jgi:hypothetical protein
MDLPAYELRYADGHCVRLYANGRTTGLPAGLSLSIGCRRSFIFYKNSNLVEIGRKAVRERITVQKIAGYLRCFRRK